MPKILIVDDEPLVLAFTRSIFTRAGYDVTTAAAAEPAMEACRSQAFDVVLSDVRMPGIDGHELARWVAINYPDTRTVLMSGYDLQCQKCPYSPRCVLLSKPFLPGQVITTIGRVLQDRA